MVGRRGSILDGASSASSEGVMPIGLGFLRILKIERKHNQFPCFISVSETYQIDREAILISEDTRTLPG
jgi:hypothetical protein